MDRNKWKQKLEQRHIQPAPDAWQRLEQQLDKAPGQDRPWLKKNRALMAAAALLLSVSGLVALLYYPFSKNTVDSAMTTKPSQHSAEEIRYIRDDSQKVIVMLSKSDTQAVPSPGTAGKNSPATTVAKYEEHPTPAPNALQAAAKNNPKAAAFENLAGNKPAASAEEETERLLNEALQEQQRKKQVNILTQAKASILLDETENEIQNNKNIKSRIYNEIDKKYYHIKTVFTNK